MMSSPPVEEHHIRQFQLDIERLPISSDRKRFRVCLSFALWLTTTTKKTTTSNGYRCQMTLTIIRTDAGRDYKLDNETDRTQTAACMAAVVAEGQMQSRDVWNEIERPTERRYVCRHVTRKLRQIGIRSSGPTACPEGGHRLKTSSEMLADDNMPPPSKRLLVCSINDADELDDWTTQGCRRPRSK